MSEGCVWENGVLMMREIVGVNKIEDAHNLKRLI